MFASKYLNLGYILVIDLEKDKRFNQVVQKIDPRNKLVRAWELKGGISARVTALEIEQSDGQTKKLIVRQHGAVDLKQNPQIAADEFKLLHRLQSANLATPLPYYFDQSGEILSTPYVVIEYIEGKTEFAPSDIQDLISQLATHLSRIHAVNYAQLDLSFLPLQEAICAEKLREHQEDEEAEAQERRIQDALEAAWPFPQHNPSVLLHGDFWPGNVLWKDRQLVAIIDWEDARLGDPLSDIANSRLEILWAFGSEAMQSFTEYYRSLTNIDLTNLPYWDLYAAWRPAAQFAEWAADEFAEKTMRERHSWFIVQALENLVQVKGAQQ